MSKKKILVWSDSPAVSTGFGVVTKHVVGGLHKTGKYEIHQLAINHDGRFIDSKDVPWQIQPAKLLDPSDPYGNQMFVNAVMKEDYDLIWILNDNYVTTTVAPTLQAAREKRAQVGMKVPKIVYYYPVDCQVVPEGSKMLEVADVCVAYTDHGREETLAAMPSVIEKICQIPHGVDSKIFKPMGAEKSAEFKKKFFNVDKDTFVVGNFNRNTTRKQLPYTFLAFKEFRKVVPNSVLYCHAAFHDQGGDMLLAMRSLGFNSRKDIIFPVDYSPGKSVSENVLNQLYNSADMHLSTHLGEGWGLTISESMAAGTPVVMPNNTCMPQLIGEEEQRGYLYECQDNIWIDNSGYRKKGLIPDIVDKMLTAYNDGPKAKNAKTIAARDWAVEHDWSNIVDQWETLFDRVLAGEYNLTVNDAGKINKVEVI